MELPAKVLPLVLALEAREVRRHPRGWVPLPLPLLRPNPLPAIRHRRRCRCTHPSHRPDRRESDLRSAYLLLRICGHPGAFAHGARKLGQPAAKLHCFYVTAGDYSTTVSRAVSSILSRFARKIIYKEEEIPQARRIKSEAREQAPSLFVRQCVDRVLLRRLERRIQRPGKRPGDRNQGRAHDPTAGHHHLQQWELVCQRRPGRQTRSEERRVGKECRSRW